MPHCCTMLPFLHIPTSAPIHPAAAAEYNLGTAHKALGSRLVVKLPSGLKAGDTATVGIDFAASPEASAVQW